MTRITEHPSPHRHLEKMTVEELTRLINEEDAGVSVAIERALPAVNQLIHAIVECLRGGGRLFYVGAGSGGRLSVLDIIELPTTYGLPKGIVNTILAGGIPRLAEAREEMEDDALAGWAALQEEGVGAADIVVGISASGTTPFVLGALTECQRRGVPTGCIVSNPDSPIAAVADYPVEVITGPEFLTGSTRMKCGTAQKMLFDMISTTTMIRLGRVLDNQMIDVLLINDKITDRAVHILMDKAGIGDYGAARDLLLAQGSVRKALLHLNIPIV
jgi:N-acetylmuramic acid 6-phosphate etherase